MSFKPEYLKLKHGWRAAAGGWLGLWLATVTLPAQLPWSIYTDSLQNGFQDWSWASRSLDNSSPVHSGAFSIRVTANAWQAASFYHSDYHLNGYTHFSFWAHGGTAGGQQLQVYFSYPDESVGPTVTLPSALPANAWQQYRIPLSSLGAVNATNLHRINLRLTAAGASGTFYLDDVQFDPEPVPGQVNINVVTTQTIRTIDARHFGVNLTMWDQYFDPPYAATTTALLQELGATAVRMPGGSLSDEYHWAANVTLNNTWQWAASFSDMVHVTTNVGAQAFVVVNYGSGTPEEAAAWVRHANVTNQLGFKYWEIGNECYGTWETDTNALAHHAYTYAVRAAEYMAQMKAADPGIKIGVVAVPGEDAYANGYSDHPALNPRTGTTHNGWTPVLLTTLKALGATPDYLIHHHYPEWTNPDNPGGSAVSDVSLLQSTGNWQADAANLRQQIQDYFGSAGTNIELVVTENNSDSGAQGRQSTSLVNGVYYADSLGRLLQTEFQGFVWWCLRNGTDHGGNFDSSLYGWRDYGDLGLVNGVSQRHPTFYAAKLMRLWARPGDRLVSASSDYPWLAAYAARQENGSLTLLVLNKSLAADLTGNISLAGYNPAGVATVRSYGIPNDEAARTNGPAADQDLTTNLLTGVSASFTHEFPRLSLTLITLTPAAPHLEVVSANVPGTFRFRVNGQPGGRYVIQSSSDLDHWTDQATNQLSGGTWEITNSVAWPQHYWRAYWQP